METERQILPVFPGMNPDHDRIQKNASGVTKSIPMGGETDSTQHKTEGLQRQVSPSTGSSDSYGSAQPSVWSKSRQRKKNFGCGFGVDSSILNEATQKVLADDDLVSSDPKLSVADTDHLSTSDESFAIVGQKQLAQCVGSSRFNMLIGILILSNTVIMGMELDQHPIAAEDDNVMMKSGMPKGIAMTVFDGFEVFFFCAFGLEFLARMAVRRCLLFREAGTYVDVLALMPVIMTVVFNLHTSKHLTLLRIVRLLKLLRLVRLFRVFKELGVLVSSLASAMRALVWIGFLLLIIVYCASIWCTMLIGHNERFQNTDATIISYEERWGIDVDIPRYWGSILRSMFTLFQIFTLDDWNEAVRPIIETHQPWMVIFFVIFLFTTSFGLLNLLMGTIVEHAIHRSKELEAEKELLLEEDYNKMMMASVRLFSMMDINGDGLLSACELKEFLEQNNISEVVEKEMMRLKIKLDYQELIEICQFILNDWDDPDDPEACDGIAMAEFVGAAIRLQGIAKSRDVLSVLVTAKSSLCRTQACEVKIGKMRAKLDEMSKQFEDKFDRVLSMLADSGPPSPLTPGRPLRQGSKTVVSVSDMNTTNPSMSSSTSHGDHPSETGVCMLPAHCTSYEIQDDNTYWPPTWTSIDEPKLDHEEGQDDARTHKRRSWLRADRNLIATSGHKTVNTLMQKLTEQELDNFAGSETAGMLRQYSRNAHRSKTQAAGDTLGERNMRRSKTVQSVVHGQPSTSDAVSGDEVQVSVPGPQRRKHCSGSVQSLFNDQPSEDTNRKKMPMPKRSANPCGSVNSCFDDQPSNDAAQRLSVESLTEERETA